MNDYIYQMYSNDEFLDQPEGDCIITTQCIKGIDYQGNGTINEYSWMSDLGQGAYAKVTLCQKNMDFSMYAMKHLKRTNVKHGRSDMDLYREPDVQKKLSHPNVVKIFEIIDDPQEDKLYLVMDYCAVGEVMTFKESTMSFKPPKALLDKNEYRD